MRGEREQPPAARFFCATPLWMSLFALSLVVPPSFCTYTYVSIWVLFSLSFTMFLLENTLSGFSTTRNRTMKRNDCVLSLSSFFPFFFFFFFVNASTKTNVKTKKYDFASGILLYFRNFDDASYGHFILYCIILVSPVSVIYLPFSSIRLSFPG